MKIEDALKRAVVLYATRYGSTKEIAEMMADKLEINAKDISSIKKPEELDCVDVVILLSPIYADTILEEMRMFIKTYFIQIKSKKLITIAVYGAVEGYLKANYADEFARFFENAPVRSFTILGRATKATMSKEDHKRLWLFYKDRLKASLKDFDYVDESKIDAVVERIRAAKI
jgi:menaquinone-dependent protoporphyrinogen IX oxidase